MTVRTRAELNSDAAARLPDNAGGEITPADVRQSVQDLADSAKLAEDLFGKQAIFIPAYGMVARTTNGAASFSTELATNDVMIRGYDFGASTVQAIQFFTALPKQWNRGTISFRAYWTAGSGSGGVAWSVKGRAVSDDDALDGAWGTGVAVTDSFIAANDLHVTAESTAVTIGGSPAAGDLIFFEVHREVANAADTLAVDARLLGIEIYITNNAGTDA